MCNVGKIEDLLINKGLYDPVKIEFSDFDEMLKFLVPGPQLSNIGCFCNRCSKDSIFETCMNRASGGMSFPVKKIEPMDAFKSYLNHSYALSFRCLLNKSHILRFYLVTTDSEIIKVGQYPIVADLSIQNKKYQSVLKEYFIEYNRALGLFKHGVGIGSFVYLRRIIEKLIYDTFKRIADDIGITESEFSEYNIKDKINALKGNISSVLVDNKNVYGILSKGIHELSEEECRNMFPTIQMGVELILDDAVKRKEEAEKIRLFTSFTAKTTRELRARSKPDNTSTSG